MCIRDRLRDLILLCTKIISLLLCFSCLLVILDYFIDEWKLVVLELDVYKRQAMALFHDFATFSAESQRVPSISKIIPLCFILSIVNSRDKIVAVSYTHLDVYKRQK